MQMQKTGERVSHEVPRRAPKGGQQKGAGKWRQGRDFRERLCRQGALHEVPQWKEEQREDLQEG